MFANNNKVHVITPVRSRSIFLDDKIALQKRFSNASSVNNNVTYRNNGMPVLRKNAFTENNVDGDIVYSSSKPVYLVLRAMGVFPFTRNAPGEAEFKVLSSAMAYSVIVFLLLVVRFSL